jgi:hypothetical protein
MHPVRPSAGKVSGASRLQCRFHLVHKVLISRHIADLDVENDISRHFWAPFCRIISWPKAALPRRVETGGIDEASRIKDCPAKLIWSHSE